MYDGRSVIIPGCAMANKDFQMERHYELWKDLNKEISRWVFAVLLVAILIPWKVLIPYLESSSQLVQERENLEKANTRLSGIKSNEDLTVKLESQLGEVKKRVDNNSWGKPIQQLKKDFRELNSALGRLSRQDPAEIMREIDSVAPVQMTSQMAQNRPIQAEANAQLLNDLARFNIQKEEILASQSPVASSSSSTHKVISKEEWKTLLSTKIHKLPQEMADRAINNTVKGVKLHAINPVRDIIEDKDYSGENTLFEKLTDQMEGLETQLRNWTEENLGHNTWFQTLETKDSEINRITRTLDKWQREFQTSIGAIKQVIQAEKSKLLKQQEITRAEINNNEAEQKRLETELETILPNWLQGFIDIKEIFQLYPLALMGITGFLGFKANLLRHHFFVIRQSLIPKSLVENDTSASSVWTLIYRGPLGTAITGLTYLIIILLFWNLFETGTELTEKWLIYNGEEAWPFIKEQSGFILWLGRLFFLISLIGIVISLLLDWKNNNLAGEQSPP